MNFNDYFKEALSYGEKLGLKGTSAPKWVELGHPSKDGTDFTPVISAGKYIGINAYGYSQITIEEEVKLTELFAQAFKKYLKRV